MVRTFAPLMDKLSEMPCAFWFGATVPCSFYNCAICPCCCVCVHLQNMCPCNEWCNECAGMNCCCEAKEFYSAGAPQTEEMER